MLVLATVDKSNLCVDRYVLGADVEEDPMYTHSISCEPRPGVYYGAATRWVSTDVSVERRRRHEIA